MRFGIYFGTTHTVVAMIDRGNYPVVSFEHHDSIPSIVSLDSTGELVFRRTDPGWTVLRSFKRLLADAHPDTEVRIGNRAVLLADLLTGFLSHLRQELLYRSNAGLRKKDSIEVAASVPANASTAQRLMTMDAYRRAGFDVNAVLTSSGISRLGGDDFDGAIAQLVLAKRGSGTLTDHLLDEVREQKESLTPNTRKFVVDDTVIPVDEVYDACMPLVDQTVAAMAPAMRDPRRGSDEVAWSELAGIYVVGGASSFPPVYRALREQFGAHRVRRSPHPFGSCAIGLAIHLDDRAGYKLKVRLTRHFGVFREDEQGSRISFDVLVPKDTPLPAQVSRRYRAAHNVGHYRFVECGRIDEGRPEGNLAAWDEVLFPFDPTLRDRDLSRVQVERLGHGPEVEEIYKCGSDGTVTASLRVLDDGFERTLRLSRR